MCLWLITKREALKEKRNIAGIIKPQVHRRCNTHTFRKNGLFRFYLPAFLASLSNFAVNSASIVSIKYKRY